jgi:ABC-type phosphate transport system substrate-binding protein
VGRFTMRAPDGHRSARSSARVPLLVALLLLAAFAVAGCGRDLPDDEAEPVPTGGDPTGAFGEGGGASAGRVTIAGVPVSVRLARAAARGFAREEPETTVVIRESDADAAIQALCAAEVDVAGTDRELTEAERRACRETGEGAVELHLADADAQPVFLATTQKALFDKLELEALLDFVFTNAEAIAEQARLRPLDTEELDDAQTRFERALAGLE